MLTARAGALSIVVQLQGDNMKRIFFAVAFSSVLFACAPEKQTVETNQTPSSPVGSIVGMVTSLRTGLPLPGVTVSVPTGSGVRTATSGADGSYALGDLAAGATYSVRFSLTGYVARFEGAAIPDTAGDYPSTGIVQVDVALPQANATVSGKAFTGYGVPAQGVVVTVDLRPQGYDLVASATTDAAGGYSLTGLPGAPAGFVVPVVTQPWDTNSDGIPDYDSLARTADTYPSATTLLDFDLRLAAADLLLIGSNVDVGTIDANAPILLTFNRALDAALTTATLYDSTAARYVAVTISVDTSGKVLTVDPAGGTPLAAWHNYTLTIDGTATNGATRTVGRSFQATVTVALLPPVTGLTVNPSVADFDTATFSLSWTAATGASGYEVWVRDTSRNPSWLYLTTAGSSPTPSASVTLPATFDYYSADGMQTPLAFGVAVDFVVVARNSAGDAPLPSTATPVSRADAVAPIVEVATQSSSADNTAGGSAKTITLTLTFSEYMDTAVLPAIALPVAGETATFAWNANRLVGVFTITIPATTNGTGAYTVTGAKDTSGNTMTPKAGNLTAPLQVVVNGGFESALTGWTTSFTSTSTAPVAIASPVYAGTGAAQLGNATAAAQSGLSTLSQTVTLPTGYASILFSVAYRPYTTWPYYGWDTSSCSIKNAAGTTTLLTLFTTYQNLASYTTASTYITGYAGQTVQVWCQTSQVGSDVTGMYLDQVSILATP